MLEIYVRGKTGDLGTSTMVPLGECTPIESQKRICDLGQETALWYLILKNARRPDVLNWYRANIPAVRQQYFESFFGNDENDINTIIRLVIAADDLGLDPTEEVEIALLTELEESQGALFGSDNRARRIIGTSDVARALDVSKQALHSNSYWQSDLLQPIGLFPTISMTPKMPPQQRIHLYAQPEVFGYLHLRNSSGLR